MENIENQKVDTRGRRLKSRYKERYPDKDFETEEGLYELDDLAAQELEDLSARDSRNQEENKKLSDLFASAPHSATMFREWAVNGTNPIAYIVKNFGKDAFMDAISSDEGQEMFLKAQDEWLKNVEDDRKFEEEREKNFDKSLEDLEAFKASHNLSDEQTAEVFKRVHQIAADVLEGKYTTDCFEMVLKAMNYDTDVEGARHEGEVAGKNAKIDAKLRKSRSAEAEVPPTLGGQGGASSESVPEKPKRKNMFGL